MAEGHEGRVPSYIAFNTLDMVTRTSTLRDVFELVIPERDLARGSSQ